MMNIFLVSDVNLFLIFVVGYKLKKMSRWCNRLERKSLKKYLKDKKPVVAYTVIISKNKTSLSSGNQYIYNFKNVCLHVTMLHFCSKMFTDFNNSTIHIPFILLLKCQNEYLVDLSNLCLLNI